MSNKIYNENVKVFFEEISKESSSMPECEENCKRGLAALAAQTRIGKATMEFNAPESKLRPQGDHHSAVLYDCGEPLSDEPYFIHFELPDGGAVDVKDYPIAGEVYSADRKEVHHFLFREILFQYSRAMMTGMLNRVVMLDLDTEIPSPAAFMKFAGMLFATGKLANYNAIFFNIHNFKYVNKVFPYSQGDIVLKSYSQLIAGYAQDDEIVCRLGGDNYAMLVKVERCEAVLEKLQNVRITHSWNGTTKEFLLGVTAGVSGLDDVQEPRQVMGKSSVAYQVARRRGAGSVVEYTPELQRDLMKDESVLANFRQALAAREFVVYYQPKVSLEDNTICGAEALVRWMRNGEIVPPMSFIPQLEREGSVCQLDYYVLERVCEFLKDRMDKGLPMVDISVNFSRKHLEEDDLVERVVKLVDSYGIDHRYIEIELTESEDFQNYEIMSNVINGFKSNGIGTSIDDFGTGFSSLNMIKQVDLNVIKIDKSFIPLESEYDGKSKDVVMFKSIVKLIRALDKKIVAEGVETTKQLEYLKEVGCDIVQGYVFDKPLPQPEFEKRLNDGYESEK